MLRLLLAAIFMMAASSVSFAQQFPDPNKTVRIIVPFNAGGYADTLARTVASGLSTTIRQPVLVENRPGGFVAVGAQYIMGLPADGHTMMLTGNGMTAVKRFNPDMTIDLHREFSITNIIVKSPLVAVISRDIQITDARQFIDIIKNTPERYSFASMSGGGIAGMGAMLFLNSINGNMLNVPYSGYAPAIVDLQASRINMMVVEIPTARQLVDSGNRALMVSSANRTSSFPDLPTWKELGINNEFYAFQALWVRSNTPRHIRQELNRLLNLTINSQDVRRRFVSMGLNESDIMNENLEQHETFINNEINIWSPK